MSFIIWNAFIVLFVVIDPFNVFPVFLLLTQKETEAHRKKTALKATVIAGVILLLFAILGEHLLVMLGISESALRIAGGLLLLLAAIEMVVAKSSGMRAPTSSEEEEASHKDDISVFPLAIPLIAGPGAMASIVMLMRNAEHNLIAQIAIIGVLVFVLFINYAFLYYADRISGWMGITATNVITRVFGIILAALAVQFILDGLQMALR